MTDKDKDQKIDSEQTAPPASAARRDFIDSGRTLMASLMLGGVTAAIVGCGDDDDGEVSGSGGSGGGGKAGSGGTGGAKAGSGGTGGAKAGSGGTGGAKAGSGGTGGTGGAKAGSGGGGGTGGAKAGSGGAAGMAAAADADIEPLNALLTAEYKAITAYSAGAGLIDSAPNTDPLFALKAVIKAVAVDIQSDHKLHAAALVDAITSLDGTPVVEADVAASFAAPTALTDNPTISNVLKFAASAERGAAVAYNQTLAGIEDAKFRFLASSIGGDESQHFIVLTALVLGVAGPGANLSEATAEDVVPDAFVYTVGTKDGQKGLDMAPPDYFA